MRLHAFISGRVQGVFFRANTRTQAKELNLTGWVKNLSDGRVEVIAEGKKENLDELLRWLRKGPRFARVENVEYEFTDQSSNFNEFSIAR